MSGNAILLDDTRLIGQISQLERRTARGGRDSIDHMRGAADDLANSALGALVYANERPGREQRDPPRVLHGYAKQKGWPAGPHINLNRVSASQIRHEIETGAASEVERHPVGDGDYFIQLHDTAADGRGKWAVFGPGGMCHGFKWGRAEAEQAALDLAPKGTIQ